MCFDGRLDLCNKHTHFLMGHVPTTIGHFSAALTVMRERDRRLTLPVAYPVVTK